jgi:eukaryotic-like serine/threonine-protein kinase
LQDRVVSAVLDILPAKIQRGERRRLRASQDTQPAAYEAYIRGRGYLQEYEEPENIDSAIKEFQQAVQIDSSYAPAYAGLGEAYWIGYQQLNRGNDWLNQASENCKKALALNPRLADAQTCLGNVSFGTGKYEEAVALYQRALELDPDSEYALGQLADAYQKLNNLGSAEAAYKKAIALRPNYWGVYSGLGAFYAGQARYAEAADMYRKVVALAPDNYRGHSNLGGIYLLQGHYQEAISELNRSIELQPNALAYSNLGTAYFALRRFADAAESFQQAAKFDDRNWINWGNLGDALYWTLGRRQEAKKPYQTAILLASAKLEVNPRDANTLAGVACYYAMLDNKAQAEEILQRALEVAPGDPDVMFRAGIVYNHFGDSDRTLAWLKKAVDHGFSRSSIRDLPDFDPLKGNPQFRALVVGN